MSRRMMTCKLDGFTCCVVQDRLMEEHIREKHPEFSNDITGFYRKHLSFDEQAYLGRGSWEEPASAEITFAKEEPW